METIKTASGEPRNINVHIETFPTWTLTFEVFLDMIKKCQRIELKNESKTKCSIQNNFEAGCFYLRMNVMGAILFIKNSSHVFIIITSSRGLYLSSTEERIEICSCHFLCLQNHPPSWSTFMFWISAAWYPC